MEPNPQPKILLVEDEPHLQFTLKLNLEEEGYEVIIADDGITAFTLYNQCKPFSAIILDVMLPEADGFEVARKIRAGDVTTGILMLTARAADEDRVTGLQAGVDDYITKPFNLEELMLRIKRMIKRSVLLTGPKEDYDDPVINYGPFSLNCEELSLEGPNGKYELTALETDCLKAFLTNPARVLSREFLLENVWGLHGHQETRTVDNFVMRLRRYIEKDPKKPLYLESIRGRGYRFIVSEEQHAG